MKPLFLSLFFVLATLGTDMSRTICKKNDDNKLELVFKIKQDVIKKSDGYFDAELKIRNISNDNLLIPSWYFLDIGCGVYPGHVMLEIYHLNGKNYVAPPNSTDIDILPEIEDSLFFKAGDSINLYFSKTHPTIACGCPITKKGIYKIRAVIDLNYVEGLYKSYYSNYDTLRVK